MRIGRIKQLNNDPPPAPELSFRGLAQANLRKHFSDGIKTGVEMTLDHIEGKEAGGVPYTGPLPDELREYIARTRRALADA